ALSFRLLGDNLLAARLPSIAFSTLGIAISFSLGRRLLGRGAGLVAAAGFASSFWALMFARLAVRTGSMPVMAMISAYLLLRLAQRKDLEWPLTIGAGLALGLTLYTYPSALVFPALMLAWLGFMHLIREMPTTSWRSLGLAYALMLIMAIPLLLAWLNPEATARADAVNAPLESLLDGDPSLVIANVVPVLGVFSVAGDSGLEFNIQNQPIFPTIPLAILFYLGLIWSMFGVFDRREATRVGYAFILLMLFGMLVPTLVTERPVNPSRTIGLLAVVYLLPAVATMKALNLAHGADRPDVRLAVFGVVAAALIVQMDHSIRHYFEVWPSNPVVAFLYQEAYQAIAQDELHWADEHDLFAIGGLTPYEMDPASMRLLAEPDPHPAQVVYFDAQTSLLIPGARKADATRILAVPSSISLHPALGGLLEPLGLQSIGSNRHYRLYEAAQPAIPTISANTDFGRTGAEEPLIRLLRAEPIIPAVPGQALMIVTAWEVLGETQGALRIFVHVVDQNDSILAQSDILGVPPDQWREGQVFLQAHDFLLPIDAPPGPYGLRVGLYDPNTTNRLAVLSPPGGNSVHIELEE
ncbi:MAG: hypothetical protein GYB68_19555, partial [Chloroflexi bacterium]|nr:hypothetical protein [Chloroflexota bacterium]